MHELAVGGVLNIHDTPAVFATTNGSAVDDDLAF